MGGENLGKYEPRGSLNLLSFFPLLSLFFPVNKAISIQYYNIISAHAFGFTDKRETNQYFFLERETERFLLLLMMFCSSSIHMKKKHNLFVLSCLPSSLLLPSPPPPKSAILGRGRLAGVGGILDVVIRTTASVCVRVCVCVCVFHANKHSKSMYVMYYCTLWRFIVYTDMT